MDNKATHDEIAGDNEELNILNASCFVVKSEDDIIFYVAGILDAPESIFERGLDFMKDDKSFFILYNIFRTLLYNLNENGIPAFTFLLEENYVDRIYRDSYYAYFSGKHFCYDRFCKRIFLFADVFDRPILDMKSTELSSKCAGSIVIQPIPGRSVGRTLLNAKYFMGNSPCFIRTAQYHITVFGKRISVNAFPYSMQDGETTTCAEITILNLMDYYSHSYPEYSYLLPSDINRIARENGYERSLPTHGLKYEMISKAFCENGFYPRLYSSEKMPKEKFRRILYYYIESGIPLSLGVTTGVQNKHSIVVIGHGDVNLKSRKFNENCYACLDRKSGSVTWIRDASDIVDAFCVMDDNQIPYTLMSCSINERGQLKLGDYIIETMMVPLYKKMYLEASDASDIFKLILASKEYGICNSDFSCVDNNTTVHDPTGSLGKKENPVAVRIFMASSRSLRKCRDEQFLGQNEEARAWYSMTLFPKFVWVCELSLAETYTQEVIGEIILDATSSAEAYADGLIIAHYPKRIFCRLPQDAGKNANLFDEDEIHEIKHWHSFSPYDSNLYATTEQ